MQFQDLKDEKLCANLMKVYYTVCVCACVCMCKIAGSPDDICHGRMLSSFVIEFDIYSQQHFGVQLGISWVNICRREFHSTGLWV